jgi:hypothetical protein
MDTFGLAFIMVEEFADGILIQVNINITKI